jgi:hypothetical protein
MDLKNAPLHYTKRGQRRLHQRQSHAFTHTLLSAYLCHDDITIPSYSIIHIASPNKLYLHDKSLPPAHPPPHTPRTILGIKQHYSLYHFSTIIFQTKKEVHQEVCKEEVHKDVCKEVNREVPNVGK